MIITEDLAKAPECVKNLQLVPEPTDFTVIRCCERFVQYLAKFMPGLAAELKPLAHLLHQDAERIGGEIQEAAMSRVKALASHAPVLKFNSL